MSLDFRKLTVSDQQKAMRNLLRIEGDSPNYIAYLFANEAYDIWGWYDLNQTVEGFDYWSNIKEKTNEEQ